MTAGADEDLSSSQTTCSTRKAWVLLLLFHTGTQLSIPNMVCLHFSVTHGITVTPVAPPAYNHRASPLLPGLVFKAVTQILCSLTKTSSENSGVGGYLTGESNYNWHHNTRQTAGNLTLTTVHKLQVTVIVLKSFSPNRNRQVGEALTELCWLIDNHFEKLMNTNHMTAVFDCFHIQLSWLRERWSCFGP